MTEPHAFTRMTWETEPRRTVNVEALVVQLLAAILPDDVDVTASSDVDTDATVRPLVVITQLPGWTDVDSARPGAAAVGMVTADILAASMSLAERVADMTVGAFTQISDRQGMVLGVGYVYDAAPESLPRRTATLPDLGGLTQYTASWLLTVKPVAAPMMTLNV